MSYAARDVVMVTYSTVTVGRYLSEDEAEILNAGGNPWEPMPLTRVFYPVGPVHYFPCEGDDGLARSIRATTCMDCLLERAGDLRGWRWREEMNTEEVTILKTKLGKAVKDYHLNEAGEEEDQPENMFQLKKR